MYLIHVFQDKDQCWFVYTVMNFWFPQKAGN
jgi:hypothetical protein